MRSFLIIGTMILLVASMACTTSEDSLTAPSVPTGLNYENGLDSETFRCHNNMSDISGQAVIFFAAHGRYPENLKELDMAGLSCPSCGEEYILVGTETDFYVGCPLPFSPNHGYIHNGIPSWSEGPEEYESACRANMRTIAGQAVIFFASNGRFPRDLEEMGMAGTVCPECGEEYEIIGIDDYFFVGCPLPFSPNHGNIDNGIASWPQEPGEYENACRANMRTIASQATIFFASNDRYPRDLEEMGMAGTVCPECGEEYEIIGTEDYFYVGCPLPFSPNHGNIDDGVPSWQ